MNPSWAGILGVAFGAAAAGLVVWPFAGATWAWAAVGAVLALRVLYHAIHLAALHAWLRRPTLETLPRGRGAWEEALADLHRLFKGRDAEQQQLLRTLARFRAAGRALPDGVVILDRENHIEWANPTAARYFGIDARRDFGQPVTNFVRHPDFVAYLAAGEFADPLVLRSARSDAVLSLRVIEFGDEQKLLNSRDVTAEDRLDTMRRDFVANVSHELKTPVTVLSGFVETLGDESLELLPQQKRRFLGLMAEQARRMQRLVEDLRSSRARRRRTSSRSRCGRSSRGLPRRHARSRRAAIGSRSRSGRTAGCSAARRSCTARFRTWCRTRCATRPKADRCGSPGGSRARAGSSASPTPASASSRGTCRG